MEGGFEIIPICCFSKKGYDKPITGLKAWTKMVTPQATFPVSAFSIFLPPEETEVGQPWYMIEPRLSKFGKL